MIGLRVLLSLERRTGAVFSGGIRVRTGSYRIALHNRGEVVYSHYTPDTGYQEVLGDLSLSLV